MMLVLELLLDIMALLPQAGDVSRLMRTCRALYTCHGVRILLSHGAKLHSPRQLKSFHDYLLTTNGYDHLRALEIGIEALNNEKMKLMLVDVLRHARRLEKLKIQEPFLLASDSRVSDAIARLRNLKAFSSCSYSFEGADFNPSKMLTSMKSKLVKASIDFGNGEDPIDVLENFASSLEELEVIGVVFKRKNIQYPKMKTLSVESWRVSEIGPLIHAYPNLRTLDIQGYLRAEHHNNHAAACREMNKTFQLIENSWKTLSYVHTTAIELYALAINCKIHCLHVENICDHKDIVMLAAVLPDCRPSVLRIRSKDKRSFGKIAKIIPAADLIHLNLWIDLSGFSTSRRTDRNFELGAFLNSLQRLKKMMKFELSFYWRDRRLDLDDPCALKGEPPAMQLFLQALDVKALACQIMTLLPSLQLLHLNISCNKRDKTYWQANTGDLRSVKEVVERLGRQMMAQQ